MAGMAKVIIIGNLTKEPKVATVQSNGKSVCELSVAVNRPERETLFINAVCFGKVAENCGKYLKKGSAVIINGDFDINKWQDKNTGEKKEKSIVKINDIQFLDKVEKSNRPAAGNENTAPDVPDWY